MKNQRILLPIITLAILLVLTFVASVYVKNSVDSIAFSRFKEQTSDDIIYIGSILNFYKNTLYGAQGLYGTHPPESQKEFSAYFKRLVQPDSYPGILSMAFVERVNAQDLPAFVERMSRQSPGFKVTPIGERPEYYIIKYNETLAGTEAALGVDAHALAGRTEAIEKARDTGLIIATPKVQLFTAPTDNKTGVVLYAPIYRAGAPQETVKERRDAIIGEINAVIVTQELFGSIFAKSQNFALEVFDGTDLTKNNLYYDSDEAMHPFGSYTPRFVRERQFMVADRTWTLRFYTLPGFQLSYFAELAPFFTFAFGGLLSVLLAFIIYMLGAARERAVLIAEQITGELKVEKEKAEMEAANAKKFQEAVDAAGEHIIITDPDGVILYANKTASKITGYSETEMLGKRPSLWGNRMSKEFYEKMWKTIKVDKQQFHDEIKNRRKDGEEYIADIYIAPVLDARNDVKFFVSIERDITKEKAIDRAKTEFVSLASHQLRTPLSSIKWSIELLMEDKNRLSEKQQERLRDIYISNERVINLVNDLLNVSRMEAGVVKVHPQAVDVCQLIHLLVRVPRRPIEIRGLKINASCPDDLGNIQLDPVLFNQALQNVLDNAISYATEKSVIDVVCTKADDGFLIAVHNEGPGILKSDEQKIFTKFYRGAGAQRLKPEGSGLGLFIAKSIIEAQGGTIWFESSRGKGVTFFLRFPSGGKQVYNGRILPTT